MFPSAAARLSGHTLMGTSPCRTMMSPIASNPSLPMRNRSEPAICYAFVFQGSFAKVPSTELDREFPQMPASS
jgi:hypothetical protein